MDSQLQLMRMSHKFHSYTNRSEIYWTMFVVRDRTKNDGNLDNSDFIINNILNIWLENMDAQLQLMRMSHKFNSYTNRSQLYWTMFVVRDRTKSDGHLDNSDFRINNVFPQLTRKHGLATAVDKNVTQISFLYKSQPIILNYVCGTR